MKVQWAVEQISEGWSVRRGAWRPGHIVYSPNKDNKHLELIQRDVTGVHTDTYTPTLGDLEATDWDRFSVVVQEQTP